MMVAEAATGAADDQDSFNILKVGFVFEVSNSELYEVEPDVPPHRTPILALPRRSECINRR